jgi:SAM-dependent methyltransferase
MQPSRTFRFPEIAMSVGWRKLLPLLLSSRAVRALARPHLVLDALLGLARAGVIEATPHGLAITNARVDDRGAAALRYLSQVGVLHHGRRGYRVARRWQPGLAAAFYAASAYADVAYGYATGNAPATTEERDELHDAVASGMLASPVALAAAEKLLPQHVLERFDTFVDLGCGSGEFLLWLAARAPDARLVGVDHDLRAVQSRDGLRGRAQLVEADVRDAATIAAAVQGAHRVLVSGMFVFHEIADTDVVDLWQYIFRSFPDPTILVTELVPRPAWTRHFDRHLPIAEVELVHALTGQEVRPIQEWEALAGKADGTVLESLRQPMTGYYAALLRPTP